MRVDEVEFFKVYTASGESRVPLVGRMQLSYYVNDLTLAHLGRCNLDQNRLVFNPIKMFLS